MFTSKKVVVAVATIAGVFLLASCSAGDIVDDAGSGSGQAFEESDRDRARDRDDEFRERDERPSREESPAPSPVPESQESSSVDPNLPVTGDRETADGVTLEIPASFPPEMPLIEGTLTLAEQYGEGAFNSFSVGLDVKGDATSIEAQATELLTNAGFVERPDSRTEMAESVSMATFDGTGDINHVVLLVGEYPDEPGNVLVLYNVDLSDWGL